jgi:hypothetical protein
VRSTAGQLAKELRMRSRGGPNLILQHHDDIAFSRYRYFGQEGLEAAR